MRQLLYIKPDLFNLTSNDSVQFMVRIYFYYYNALQFTRSLYSTIVI